MGETKEQAGFHFVFKMTEDEARLFRRLLTKNLTRYIDRRVTVGVTLAGFASVIIPVFIAYGKGLLPVSTVLLSELSLTVGYLGLLIATVWGSRRMYRNLFKVTRSAQASFDCTFDDSSVVVKKGTLESRMPLILRSLRSKRLEGRGREINT